MSTSPSRYEGCAGDRVSRPGATLDALIGQINAEVENYKLLQKLKLNAENREQPQYWFLCCFGREGLTTV